MIRRNQTFKNNGDEDSCSHSFASRSSSSVSSTNGFTSNIILEDSLSPVNVSGEKAFELMKQSEKDIQQILDNTATLESCEHAVSLNEKREPQLVCSSSFIHRTFEKIAMAGEDITLAWGKCEKARSPIDNETNSKEIEDSFRAIYMNMVTDAFSDELELLRSGNIPSSTPTKQQDTKGKGKNNTKSILVENKETFDIATSNNEKKNYANDPQMIDFDVLVNCLESGIDIYTEEEKQLVAINL